MRLFRFIIFSYFLTFINPFQGHGQSEIKFFSTTKADGLMSDFIECVEADHHGYVWLGTYDGIQRWDGISGKTYKAEEGGLLANIVYTIFEDSQHRLWAGTIDGLCLYDPDQDAFKPFDLTGYPTPPVNEIAEDSTGNIWLATSDGLCKIKENKPQWIDTNFVYFDLDIDSKNQVWTATFQNGVIAYNQKGNQIYHLTHDPGNSNSIGDNKLRSILVDSEDNIWIGTVGNGVFIFSPDQKEFSHYPQLSDQSAETTQDAVMEIYEDQSKQIWFGINDEYVFLKRHATSTDNPVALKQRTINSYLGACRSVFEMSEDRYGNMYFATHGQGLITSNIHKNKIKHGLNNTSALNPLTLIKEKPSLYRSVTCFEKTTDHTVWIGIEGEGIWSHSEPYQPFLNAVKDYSTRNGLLNNNVMDIEADENGLLWIASRGGGLFSFDPQSQQSIRYSPDAKELQINSIDVLLLDGDTLWLGTHGDGLALFDIKTKTFTHYRNNTYFDIDLQDINWINHIFKDSRGRVWIGSYLGLHCIEGNKVSSFHKGEKNLQTEYINMIAEDSEGTIWIGGASGGLEYLAKEDTIFQSAGFNGLIPRDIKSIGIDEQERFWLGTSDGLYLIDTSNHVYHYAEDQGIQSVYTTKAILLDDGNCWLGGSNGFHAFTTTALPYPEFQSTVVLNSLTVNQELQQAIKFNAKEDVTTALKVAHDQNTFTFTLSLLNQFDPHSHVFQYQLKSNIKTQAWKSIPSSQRHITFEHLSPGSYTFLIRSRNLSNKQHSETHHFNFIILPPWWESTWFKILIVIFLFAIGILIFWIRTRAIRSRNIILEKQVKKRTLELEEANTELQDQNDQIVQQNETLTSLNSEYLRQGNTIRKQQKQLAGINRNLRLVLDTLKLKGDIEADKLQAIYHTIHHQDAGQETLHDALSEKRILLQIGDSTLRDLLWNLFSDKLELLEVDPESNLVKTVTKEQPHFIFIDAKVEGVIPGLKQTIATNHIPVFLLSDEENDLSLQADYVYSPEQLDHNILLQLSAMVERQEKIKQQLITSYNYIPNASEYNKQDSAFLTELVQIIEENLTDSALDHKVICQALGLSRTILYSKMKQLTGLGVHEFIRSIRLKKSIELLKKSDKTVSEIAYEVGFNSPSYYIRCFSKQYGASPKEYVKR